MAAKKRGTCKRCGVKIYNRLSSATYCKTCALIRRKMQIKRNNRKRSLMMRRKK